jgi:hypothetical protein
MFDATNYGGASHPIDRRRFVRSRSYLGGQMVGTATGFSTHCVVRITSLDGARFDLAHPVLAPADSLLVILKQGFVYETATVWIDGAAVGLRLLASHPLHGEVSARHARARDLWIESLPRSGYRSAG